MHVGYHSDIKYDKVRYQSRKLKLIRGISAQRCYCVNWEVTVCRWILQAHDPEDKKHFSCGLIFVNITTFCNFLFSKQGRKFTTTQVTFLVTQDHEALSPTGLGFVLTLPAAAESVSSLCR